jgi:putative flippase GtrA
LKKIFDHLWLNYQTNVRFIMVGISNTIFSYFIFVGLDYFFKFCFSPRYVAYMLAMVLSNVIAVTIAYFLHKRFTFKSKTKGKAAFREYLRFYSTYIFTTILSLIFLPVFVEFLKLDPKIAVAIIMLLLTVVSYVIHLHFTFRRA